MSSDQLSDVLLGNNPHPTPHSAWIKASHRTDDLLSWDYGLSNWSIACNIGRIGPGTVGWIYRTDGSYGHLAGLIVFSDRPWPENEPGGVVHYCDGWLWRLPREWWIDGARVHADKDWSGRAPFGNIRRFRNGESLNPGDRAILAKLLHPVALGWIATTVDGQPNGSGPENG